jgi:serine/threonine protein phosphatase PrpC
VLGVLAVARSLGDHGLKEFVIAKPYLSSTKIRLIERQQQRHDDVDHDDGNTVSNDKTMISSLSSSHQAPYTEDDFLIVACDGLWDVMEDQEVVDFIRKYVHENDTNNSRENVASIVIEEALKRGSTDNITVIVYWL